MKTSINIVSFYILFFSFSQGAMTLPDDPKATSKFKNIQIDIENLKSLDSTQVMMALYPLSDYVASCHNAIRNHAILQFIQGSDWNRNGAVTREMLAIVNKAAKTNDIKLKESYAKALKSWIDLFDSAQSAAKSSYLEYKQKGDTKLLEESIALCYFIKSYGDSDNAIIEYQRTHDEMLAAKDLAQKQKEEAAINKKKEEEEAQSAIIASAIKMAEKGNFNEALGKINDCPDSQKRQNVLALIYKMKEDRMVSDRISAREKAILSGNQLIAEGKFDDAIVLLKESYSLSDGDPPSALLSGLTTKISQMLKQAEQNKDDKKNKERAALREAHIRELQQEAIKIKASNDPLAQIYNVEVASYVFGSWGTNADLFGASDKSIAIGKNICFYEVCFQPLVPSSALFIDSFKQAFIVKPMNKKFSDFEFSKDRAYNVFGTISGFENYSTLIGERRAAVLKLIYVDQ